MNNYNELINKPTINGKELIGDVEVSGLPAVTSADAGKVPIVGEDGSWTIDEVSELPVINNSDTGKVLTANNSEWIASEPLDFNMSTAPIIAGFFTNTSGGAITKTPIFKITFFGDDYTQTNHIIDLREYTGIHDIVNFDGVIKLSSENLVEFSPIGSYYTQNNYSNIYYIKGDSSFNDGYPCLLFEGHVTGFDSYMITIYYI